jgi:hypothetical protein
LLVVAPVRGVNTRNHFTNSNMPKQTEPTSVAGDQQVRQPTEVLPATLEETRRQFVEALDWAGVPLYATDGSGKTSTNIQNITEAVQQGKQLTPEQVQQTREAIKLLDGNEIVNTRPLLHQLKDTFAILSSPEGPQQVHQPVLALHLPEPAPELVQLEAKETASVQLTPTPRPAAKAKIPNDDRDDFIRNALPVAAALRRSGKPEEAKQLELVANALLQTKSLERTPTVQEQATNKEESLKDLLANVYKAIDQDPSLKNMPEAKNMRRAGNRLEKDGMLNITVRNGVVVSFVSNFTDNFSRTQKIEPAAPEVKPVAARAAPIPRVVATPPLAATQAASPVRASAPSVVTQATPSATEAAAPQVKVATIRLTFTNPEEPGRGMPDVLSKRFREAGADAEIISTKPAPVAGQSVSELKVSYRLDESGIDKVSALLDAAAIMRGSKVQEMPGDPQARKEAAQQQEQAQAKQAGQQRQTQAQQQVPAQAGEKMQQSVAQPAPLFQVYPAYTSFAPSTETGIIESRKAVSHNSPQLNVAITNKGEFGINPKVNQQRLIGDGIASLSQFFDYALPTSSHKIAHVGLAEPGQLRQTETGWEVVMKGKLAITDTEGNVFKPQVGPAQQLAPTPAAEKQFLAVQTPTRLARTADGWKVTEQGLIGFSAAGSVYQAQSPAPVPQVVAQGKAFNVADLPVELLAKVGVPVAELERTGQLQKLLDGKKTDLIPGLQLPPRPRRAGYSYAARRPAQAGTGDSAAGTGQGNYARHARAAKNHGRSPLARWLSRWQGPALLGVPGRRYRNEARGGRAPRGHHAAPGSVRGETQP